ncbi:MAG: hypothetical protein K2Y21_10895 [Phycisphaerales bacterium]|nr:hypothetical protein [Phycisphaerales bacterium]
MRDAPANLLSLAALPLHDWQFWVATAIALIALWIVINSVVPPSLLPWKRKPKGTKASLTISAKRADARPTTPSDPNQTDH